MIIIIFVIILILLIVIFVLLTIYNNNKIEKFVNYSNKEIQFELNPNNSDINKFELVSYSNRIATVTKKIVLYGLPVYIYECVDMPSPSDSIYAVFSSFVFNVNSPNSSGRSLLSTTKSVSPQSVPLKDNGLLNKIGFNYIFFNFPDEIKKNIFSKIEITFANNGGYDESNFTILSFDNTSITSKIAIDTLIRIPVNRLNTGVNQKIVFESYSEFTMENANLLLTVFRLNEVDISSIKIYFKSPIIDDGSSQQDKVTTPKEMLKIISTNENEQLDIMGFDIFNSRIEDEEESGELYSSTGITQNLNLLLKLRVPWGVYDASSVCQNNKSVLLEQLKGGCKNATIRGPSSIEKDNIYYIKGNVNTCIEFPENSMPKTYTICAITKYENPNANKLDVLKTLNFPKITIGHASNNRGIVTKQNNRGNNINHTTDSSSDFKSKNATEWVITCIKSSGKDVRKTIIINNEKRGTVQLGNLSQNNQLIINSIGLDKRDCSEFGFAYMIIWDQLLSDNELVMVSNILNTFVNDTSKKIDIDRNIITIKDGSSIDRAADSAIDIMTNFCIKQNGRYWIKPPGAANPEHIFCILDNNCKGGGGWMLAMKGSRHNYKTFSYNSVHWTTPTILLPSRQPDYDFEPNSELMETELDAKYNIFNTFKAKECLAMFDPRDCGVENSPEYYFNLYRFKKYGWLWRESNFNGGDPITLLNFFRNDIKQFDYSTPTVENEVALKNYMNSVYRNNRLVTFLRFSTIRSDSMPRFKQSILFDYTNLDYQSVIDDHERKGPCNIKIWSTQKQFYSFGFNVGPVIDTEAARKSWPHRVRWGCSFNENEDSKPTSNDVSGGIGMEARGYSAGDVIGCCHDTKGQNKNFSFKWFIR
jgi:hypothetical protein